MSPRSPVEPDGKRVAYYTRRFPVLTETFIQRELTALRALGLDVITFADSSDALETLGGKAREWAAETIYLQSREESDFRSNFRHFLLRCPWRLWHASRQVARQNYSRFKSPEEDRAIFRRVLCLARALVENRVDHVHSPWAYISAFVAATAAKLVGIPFSVQARAFEVHAAADMYLLPEKFAAATFIVTNTRYNEAHVASLMREEDRHKIRVIHNGIDLPAFVPVTPAARTTGAIRVLTVARLVQQKGLTYLLEACDLLRQRGYSLDCTIIGAPFQARYAEYHARLLELQRELGLQECVHFMGGQPFETVLQAYQDVDLFVLPCVVEEDGNRDIIPNSLIEAMAMRLAVVSTPVGGVPEIVDDGESGLLVPPRQSGALADAMARLIDDPELRTALGAAARERVEERFDIRKNAVAYRELFRSPGR